MIRKLFRLLGAVLLGAGLGLLGRDLIDAWHHGSLQTAALGQLWAAFDPASLERFQATAARYFASASGGGAASWLLIQPAFAIAGLVGIFLLLLTRRRRRHYGMR
jgi:MYXO-CTERM domain-containing protein